MIAVEPKKPLLLLVDDQAANLHVLVASLKAHYRIKTATSGVLALQLARQEEDRPHLVLLDVMMPEVSGLDVLRALRADPATREVAVIVVTADTSESSQLEALELGADDFLTKPVVPALLLARVRNLLRRKQAEARFRRVIEASPSALMIVDAARRIRFANPGAAAIFGYTPEQMTGMAHEALIPPAARERHHAYFAQFMAQPLSRGMGGGRELCAVRADGSEFPCEVGLSPIEAEEGQQILVSVVDMSNRAKIEARLRELNDDLEHRVSERTAELEARNRELLDAFSKLSVAREQVTQAEKLASLGRLVASFAHDIGNPIGNVATLTSMLADKQRDLREQIANGALKRSDLDAFLAVSEESGALVMRNLERARELLVTFKQLALDQATSQRRELDLLVWLGQLSYTLSPALAEGGHHIVLDVPAGLTLATVPGLLGQVITNLVSNAVTHAYAGRRGGLIRIAATRTGDGWTELTVADDGAGISAHDLPRVFEPFFTTRAGQGGTGLGLDIVRSIVEESLAGRIAVRSEAGCGATFTIYLPGATAV
ncbi:hypothetical protein GCM10025771_06270 [Niveibacterium umoris]|uniref:histidine kinase n=1 Tax=Niveibacterium umoris TaxID=1193620 RepID=A0A840BKP5_9RHOO|nr:ATP-binding protein [Niveibacterium umoris]MBB4013825.1 PAS domain S-box-containing protein [Niveibacterium umoris]